MSEHQADHTITTMCRLLKLSTSGYYAWLEREPSARAISDAALIDRIRAIHTKSRGTYGMPRVHAELKAELKAEGTRVGCRRVGRLMRLAGLQGVTRRKGCWTTRRDRDARPAPDLVERKFVADGPDCLWVADVTYIPTWAGFLYLAVVLDAFSRRCQRTLKSRPLRTLKSGPPRVGAGRAWNGG